MGGRAEALIPGWGRNWGVPAHQNIPRCQQGLFPEGPPAPASRSAIQGHQQHHGAPWTEREGRENKEGELSPADAPKVSFHFLAPFLEGRAGARPAAQGVSTGSLKLEACPGVPRSRDCRLPR